MKTLKRSALASALAVVLGALTSAPAVAAADPEQGLACPSGFAAQIAGGRMKCVKSVTKDVSNSAGTECNNDAPFRNFQKMSGNKDICVHDDANIPGNANLAEFSNGQVLIRVPVGAKLPRSLQGKQPLRTVAGIQFFRVNENADFIFYDRSASSKARAEANRKAIEIATERSLNLPPASLASKLVSVSTTQVDASGSLDRLEAKVDLFALPQ